jgi:tRNA (guanine-N(7)-)-methyltransferase
MKPVVERCQEFASGADPLLIEVGFDHGRRLQSMATLSPEWRFLGLEVRARRVRAITERAERLGQSNLLAWRMDARSVFAGVLVAGCADAVEVLFPTPWWSPKLRAERFLIVPEFVVDVLRVLKPGGLFHVATDVPDVMSRIDEVVAAQAEFSLLGPEDSVLGKLPPCEQQSRREWSCTRDEIPWEVRRWRKL